MTRSWRPAFPTRSGPGRSLWPTLYRKSSIPRWRGRVSAGRRHRRETAARRAGAPRRRRAWSPSPENALNVAAYSELSRQIGSRMFALSGSRRDLLKSGAALGSALATARLIGFAPALAQNATVNVGELMAQGALPDVVEGDANAPVTVVEYASMTCSHCAAFATKVYPTLKSKYIDAGKAKLILREFPL